MTTKVVRYTDDRGEMDGVGPRVDDWLPPPGRLVLRQDDAGVAPKPGRGSKGPR